MRRTRGVPTRSEVSEVLKTRENSRGCAEQEAYRPKGKTKRTSSTTATGTKNFFVYTEETIYVMKETIYATNMVDDLYFKFVIPVTAKVETLRFDRSRRTVNSWSTRRPHSRSAWKTSDGRPVRWGSVTVGVRKGSYQ